MQTTLIEKDSGCSAMLRDNQTEDLTRLFSVYHECSGAKCIEPIAEIFRKHVEAEGMSLVNQVLHPSHVMLLAISATEACDCVSCVAS